MFVIYPLEKDFRNKPWRKKRSGNPE